MNSKSSSFTEEGKIPAVLHVVWSGGIGGIERVVGDLTRQRAAAGAPVGVAFGHRPGPLAEEVVSPGVDVVDLGLASGYDLRPWRLRRASGLLREWDLIHMHGFNVPLGIAAVRARKPIV